MAARPSTVRLARRSLLVRLLAITGLALAIGGALLLLAFIDAEARGAKADLEAELAAELNTLPAALSGTVVVGDSAAVQETLDRYVTDPRVLGVRFTDPTGAAVVSTDASGRREAPGWFARWCGFTDLQGAAPIEVGGRRYGTLEIRLSAHVAADRAWARARRQLATLLCVVGLDCLGIWLVVRRGLRPIEALDRAAAALAAGDLRARVAPQDSPEFDGAIAAFNRMADAVEEARASLSREKEDLSVTLASIGDGVIVTDTSGRVRFLNRVAEALTGWSSGEAIGHDLQAVFSVFDEETRRRVESPVAQALREGGGVGSARAALLLDRAGVEHPISRSAAAVIGAGGELRGAVLVFRDQTAQRQLLQEVRDGRRLLQRFIDHTPAMIHLVDGEGRILVANAEFERRHGAAPGTLAGRRRAEVVPAEAERALAADEARVRASGEAVVVEEEVPRADGVRVHSSLRFPVRGEDGQLRGIGTLTTDISERRAAERRLALLASVFEFAAEGIIITDPDARIVEVNPAFCAITGYDRREVIGQKPSLLRSGRHGPDFFAELWGRLGAEGTWHGEIWNRRKDGEVFPEMLTITAVKGRDGRVVQYIGIFSDISTLKEQQSQLEKMANFDALTQLPNRVLLSDRLQVAMAQARRTGETLAVCYMDLDHFKPVNDVHGHEAGDRLLVEMAARLKAAIRAGDTAARLGGDEFVLLLLGLPDQAEAERTLARVLKVVSQPVRFADFTATLSASIGVTFFPQDGADADTLLRHADQAMYEAKQRGRDRCHVFEAGHDDRSRARRDVLARIGTAIEGGELRLHWQPKVDLRRGAVVGAEALVRWQHPERGLLPPAEFLPLVEDSELSVALGEWVFEEALAQSARWRTAGLDLAVSVNVSGYHLLRADFVPRLKALLGHHPGVPASRFELEVLETAALGDLQGVSEIMEACRRLGVSFALDDVGTGYSSLTYFKRLPARLLKIDQSFVRNMLRDREDLAIVDGIVGLTEAFQRKVIAEGVESVDHGVMLLLLGCDLAQGYGIAPPLPAAAVADFVAAYRPDPAWVAAARLEPVRDDLSILNAEVDLRRWIRDLQAWAQAEPGDAAPPALSPGRCPFGAWFRGAGQSRHGRLPAFQAIAPIHERLHALGLELASLREAGAYDEARRRARALGPLRDELVAQLHALLVQGPAAVGS